MSRRRFGGPLAVLCAAATLVATAADPVAAAPGDISTFAGSNGEGPAIEVGQEVIAMAFAGPLLYLADQEQRVVRVVDTRNGQERVAAGNGYVGGYRSFPGGDGGPAVNAEFASVDAIATDSAGNLYVLDGRRRNVRRVGADGIITRVAGSLQEYFVEPPFAGDGGPALDARLASPTSIAVDAAGNLFIADAGYHRIRKVAPGGTITTVAGDGSATGPVADARSLTVDTAGNLYFTADFATIWRLSPAGVLTHIAGTDHSGFSGDGGPATAATVAPAGLATDAAGNLYVASDFQYVRRIDVGGTITSLPKPQPGATAQAVAIDAGGTVHTVDEGGHRVRRLTASGDTVVAGNGEDRFGGDGRLATMAQFDHPMAVVVDAGGNTYVADERNRRVRKITALGTISTLAEVPDPRGLVLDNLGRLYVVVGTTQIVRLDPTSGASTPIAGGGSRFGADADGHPATEAALAMYESDLPVGMVVDSAGNLYFAEADTNRIRKIDPSGVLTTFAAGPPEARCGAPGGFEPPPPLACPIALAADSAGNLYAAGRYSGLVRITANGNVTRLSTELPTRPSALAVDGAGNLLVADLFAGTVHLVSPSGASRFVAGRESGFSGDGGPADQAELYEPAGLFVRGADLLVADSGNNRIRRIAGVAQPTSTFTVRAWGWNGLGQLGDGTGAERMSATSVAGLGKVHGLAAGYYHSLAIKDGEVWAWGWNGTGQLGNGTQTDSSVPVKIVGLTNVVTVVAGAYHSLAIDGQSNLWAWGWNGTGMLGTGNTVDSLVPVKVLSGVHDVAAGLLHTVAKLADGSVWGWGWNGYGQLGDGTTIERHRPVKAVGIRNASFIAAGGYHTLVSSIGSLWAYGWNAVGQLGDGTTTDRRLPVKIPIPVVGQVAAGMYHSMALAPQYPGQVYAWGWNGAGAVGDGTTTDRHSPVLVPGLESVTNIAAGYLHSLAVRNDGTVRAWGFNALGQLGDGTKTDRLRPVEATGLRGASDVSGGALHTLAY